jgi:UDP:flavonoid glycosyltransferase YjiC (YdhE family)
VGSLGDLHPFIAVGRALRDVNLHVVLACAAEYRIKVEAAGLEFHPLRPGFDEIERDLGMDPEQLTRRVVARSDFLFRKLVLPYVRTAYEDMLAVTADADLVLPSSLAFGARLAAEKRGIPWIAVVLQPMMFLSSYDAPIIPKAEWLSALLRKLGPAPTRHALWILKKAVNSVFGPLHRLRAEIGLPPAAQDPLFDGQFAEWGAIALYSRLLGEVQPDYPPSTSIVGFATFDGGDAAAPGVAADLDAFLDAGPAPLVFTLGSLVVNSPGDFYRESIDAARRLGRRAVLLVGEHAKGDLANWRRPELFIGDYAPHSPLFARAAAIVHHGGIGTLAQALRAGKPQLIVPYFADQIDNASRAARLGVADILSPRRYSAASGAAALGRMLDDRGTLARAAAIRDSLAGEDGAARAARIVLDTLGQLGRK